MGNVAHDLKTPLHSIEADLEMLILLISKIPLSVIEKAIASIQSPCNKHVFDPQVIFSAMNATCKFMEMSINRSQDFMKASNNIVLLPALESFDLGAAIGSAVTCVKHVLSDRLVIGDSFVMKKDTTVV
jgi:signal transduction histidine kinase